MTLKKTKKVYVPISADKINIGHINILRTAKKYGTVVVGLLTDRAISSYKTIPSLDYNYRYEILSSIKYIDQIIAQDDLDYKKIINKLRPDFFVHGDDWKNGIQKKKRDEVIRALKKIKSKLIEPKYTKIENTNDDLIKENFKSENRVSILKRLLASQDIVRILESHNPLAGLIVENTNLSLKNKKKLEFDGMWSSSLADSVSRAKPDNQSVDYSTRILGINQILSTTSKPMIFDIDNGGQIEHINFVIKDLERAGVSAIIMEDKIGLKRNSLFKNQKGVKQDTISNFSKKIIEAKKSAKNKDFLVIARIESLILNQGVNNAIIRAKAYCKAGVDGIMIHSKNNNPKEIFEFSKKFKKLNLTQFLVSVPSTYSKTYEKELIKNGFKIVIYANQMLRSSYIAMKKTAEDILKNSRAHELEKRISPIKEILNLIK